LDGFDDINVCQACRVKVGVGQGRSQFLDSGYYGNRLGFISEKGRRGGGEDYWFLYWFDNWFGLG
jgi:hypothetical protein